MKMVYLKVELSICPAYYINVTSFQNTTIYLIKNMMKYTNTLESYTKNQRGKSDGSGKKLYLVVLEIQSFTHKLLLLKPTSF